MADEYDDDQRKAIADQVRQRRLTLGLSIDEAAQSVGMSPVTWGRVEKQQAVRGLTYAGIERALAWSAGSLDRIANGDPPVDQAVIIHEKGTATDHVSVHVRRSVDAVIEEIYESDMPESRKHELVRLIRQAEAARDAELRVAEDELARYRQRRAAG